MACRVEIDADRCKGCELCLAVCPRGCLQISKRPNKTGHFPAEVVHDENCTGCAQCGIICPDTAIKIYRDKPDQKK